jgi:hypothetical protein
VASDGDDEHAELRRRAFSRAGTDADLRRLAELQALSMPDLTPEVPVEQRPAPEPPEPREEPDEARPSNRRVILLSGAVGLLVGATLATLGILLPHGGDDTAGPPEPPGPTALAIFDRAPGERDDPAQLSMTLEHILPGGLEDAELRWLGSVAENEIYVARGTHRDVTTICLISSRPDGTGAACTEQSEFEVSGLNLGDGSLELRWGPLGTEIWVAERRD